VAVNRDNETWVDEVADNIGARTRISYRVPPPPYGVIDPVSILREAVIWLRDARAFDGLRRRAWLQLRGDVELSLGKLGPDARAVIDAAVASAVPALDLSLGAGAAERNRAIVVLEQLIATLDSGAVVVAAWHDLLAAYADETATPELCDLRESQLAASAKLHGFDWVFLPGRLGRTLDGRGDLVEGLAGRIDRLNERVDERPLAERIASCDSYLERTPPEDDVVVWVAISDVAIWRWVIELDRVTFYDGRWWSSVVANGGGDLPELAGRDETELSVLFYRLLHRDPDDQPFVVARVEVGRCRVASAVAEAKRVAMGVMNAAGLGAGELTGTPFDGGVVFSDGKLIADGNFSLDRDFAAARAERFNEAALGQALHDVEPDLVQALLANDERLSLAMTTIEWLKETKGLTPSQQLGLSLRAIEQIFSEVDERHWRATVSEHVAHPWSLTQVSNTVYDVVYRAIMSFGSEFMRTPTAEQRADFLEVRAYVMAGDRFLLRRAVERIGWLRERVESPRLARELRALESRLVDGAAAAAWLRDLEEEFARNLLRTHRLRNAILHGYPLQLDVVAANGAFARSVTIHAVHELVGAAAAGVDLTAHMRNRRDDYDKRRALLEGGAAPVDAFGWTAGT
jgi:hypothetical protein